MENTGEETKIALLNFLYRCNRHGNLIKYKQIHFEKGEKFRMADTKKEHYVPRCYLENFATTGKRIDVFDKWKLMVRSNQDIMNVAMENGFYDLDLIGLLQNMDADLSAKTRADLMEIVGTDDWIEVEKIIGDPKHIEKKHFAHLEGIYSPLLQSIIKKSYGGHSWVIKNCAAMSEEEKVHLSLFIAIQVIRTKRYRDTLGDMFAGMAEVLAYKAQMYDKDALPREAFEVKANPEFIKLQHSSTILDPEMTLHIAEILCDHVWIMYVNKTTIPFLTSDDPVVNIPHKKDPYMSHAGFASEGIEIVFPISPNLMLCMCDSKTYGHLFKDRQYYEISDPEQVEYYNMYQVFNSYRCVFSASHNFASVKQFCEEHPSLQSYQSHIEVL